MRVNAESDPDRELSQKGDKARAYAADLRQQITEKRNSSLAHRDADQRRNIPKSNQANLHSLGFEQHYQNLNTNNASYQSNQQLPEVKQQMGYHPSYETNSHIPEMKQRAGRNHTYVNRESDPDRDRDMKFSKAQAYADDLQRQIMEKKAIGGFTNRTNHQQQTLTSNSRQNYNPQQHNGVQNSFQYTPSDQFVQNTPQRSYPPGNGYIDHNNYNLPADREPEVTSPYRSGRKMVLVIPNAVCWRCVSKRFFCLWDSP